MEKKIAIVRLHRGVLDPITQVNKLMTFICDIEDVKKGDFVVVELSMKTRAKNFNNDFRVGRVEDFMIFRDGEMHNLDLTTLLCLKSMTMISICAVTLY